MKKKNAAANKKEHPHGDVQFHQPAATLVAARADDQDIEKENAEMKANDGFTDYCGGV